MLRANNARVEWDEAKKRWEVHLQIGAEVIKRPMSKCAIDSSEDVLREMAIQTARDEGYEIDPAAVTVVQRSGHAA